MKLIIIPNELKTKRGNQNPMIIQKVEN